MQELRLAPVADGEERPKNYDTQMSVGARVSTNGPLGVVSLTVTVLPDPHVKPYEVQVEVAGEFEMFNGTAEIFREFCQNNAPVIIFPYVRHLIEQLTADGRYGRVRLDPVNLQGVLKSPWVEDVALPADTSGDAPREPPKRDERGR
jgi:preprotein translocase subunit SecB